MAWVSLSLLEPLDTIVPADYYDVLKDDLRYLKGMDGTVTIEDAMFFDNDGYLGFEIRATYYPRVVFADGAYIEYDRINNKLGFYIDDALACEVSADRLKFANGYYSMDNGVGDACHMESGTSIMETVNGAADDDAFTFVNAYASAPSVTCGLQHTNTTNYDYCGVNIKTATLNTTGVTLQKWTFTATTPVVMISYYLAAGAD